MAAESYQIQFNNFEDETCFAEVFDADGNEAGEYLEGSESPAVMETPNLDDDKTESIRSKRVKIGFNSGERVGAYGDRSVDDFADGADDRFTCYVQCGLNTPFRGNLSLDDNSEAFQPQPNPVSLIAVDGLQSLRNVEITDSDGDILVGHYRIIDYITLCLGHLIPGQYIYVVFNLYEEDTDPLTSHAFWDTFLDALTFETDIDKRDDCYTVLTKILDSLGCFITYDHGGWWIIRWDEYDSQGTSILTHRAMKFNPDGTIIGYELIDLTKVIASDYDALYEGYRLSNDNAIKRFQRKASKVTFNYKYEQPKEVPCNSSFTRGTVDDDVLPLKTYDPDCWTLRKGVPGSYTSTSIEMKIAVHYDANDTEDDRYLYLTPEGTHSSSSTSQTYAESEGINVHEDDKFEASINWRLESDAGSGANYNLMRFYLAGDDGSHWLLGSIDGPTSNTGSTEAETKWWDTSNFTVNTAAGGVDIDFTVIEETDWQGLSFECPPIPVDGKLYIWLNQINQTNIAGDDQVINYSDLRFTYRPYISGTYGRITGQELNVSDGEGRKTIVKEIFISDSPKKLFKGALKKFDGVNYVLTGTWEDFIDATLSPNRLSWFIVFQWWNQFRKTRTVIEADLQGIVSDNEEPVPGSIPGLIYRWKINHGDEGDKFFMLTRLGFLDFRTCGWNGVFVETSDMDGDRDYTDDFEFRFIQ